MESFRSILILSAVLQLALARVHNEVVTLRVGDDRTLDCNMPDNDIDDITEGRIAPSWTKYQDLNPNVLAAEGQTLNSFFGPAPGIDPMMAQHVDINFDRNGDLPPVNLQLVLTDVTRGETGRYVCEVREGSTVRDTITYHVNVLDQIDEVILYSNLDAETVGPAPNTTEWTHQTSVTLGTKNSGYLACVARGGFPAPAIQVSIGNHGITGHMGITEVDYILMGPIKFWQDYTATRLLATDMFPVDLEEDGEQITCTATIQDGVGQDFHTMSASSTLAFMAKPEFKNCSTTAKTPLNSENFELRCPFLAKPAPAVNSLRWTATSTGIIYRRSDGDGDYVASMRALDGDYHYEAILTIKLVQVQDFQDYTLTVGNTEGESSVSIALLEGEESATLTASQQLSSIITLFITMTIVAALL